jgi:Family of unknown function (DUF6445)
MATAIQTMPGYLVIDNFCYKAEEVRQSALNVGFGSFIPNKGEFGPSELTGMCFWGDHSTMLKHLATVCGQPVYPTGMFFRVATEETEKAYIHSDREDGEYTAIVYLSKHEPEASGTAFFRHKESGSIILPDSYANLKANRPEWFEQHKKDMVEGDHAKWDMIQYVPGQYNRALIFDARLYHSRYPLHGIGKTAEDGRMVWVVHFNL